MRMRPVRWTASVLGALVLANCSPAQAPAGDGQPDPAAPVVDPAPGPNSTGANATGPNATGPDASASQAFEATGAGAPDVPEPAGRCIERNVATVSAAQGLTRMTTAGSYDLYGAAGDLVCSEPGQNGVGECELAIDGRAVAIGGGSGRRFEAAGGPIRLFYGPGGVSCTQAGVL